MAEEGASLGEQLIESARRNNLDLLTEIFGQNPANLIDLINHSTDPLGNTALHLAAFNGSYEVLDHLLDQEDVEVDPINRQFGDTPLHSAVRYSRTEPEHGAFLVEMLIDAGADPLIKNKDGQKPIDLADPSNTELLNVLQGAEFARTAGPIEDTHMELDDAEEGSGSESE